MEKEIEKQLFNKMKVKDFGEGMCNETKKKVLRWVIMELKRVKVAVTEDEYGGGYIGEALRSLEK